MGWWVVADVSVARRIKRQGRVFQNSRLLLGATASVKPVICFDFFKRGYLG
jgi:hypothetical protein